MNLRDDLQPCVDDARSIVAGLGLRPLPVVVRTTVWPGEPGLGSPTVTDVTLDPPPRVRDPSPRHIFAEPGVYEDGDRIVDKVSRDYAESALENPTDASTERVYLVGGDAYRLARPPLTPDRKNFEWRLHLRRMAR